MWVCCYVRRSPQTPFDAERGERETGAAMLVAHSERGSAQRCKENEPSSSTGQLARGKRRKAEIRKAMGKE
jgi:hypothetical protein